MPSAMDFNPRPLKILPDLEDFELKKGYMRALIQFAEDGIICDDESDADSVISRRAGGGHGITLAPEKAYISCRISSVPEFTWPDDEALETPDLDTELTTADTNSILSASTAQSPDPLQETFASLTTTPNRDLDLPPPTGLRPPPHPSRKRANPLPMLTVQEEPPRRSLSATNSPTNPSHALLLPPGRPSTSTTGTPSSASSRRGTLGAKSLRSTSPRRSGESLFRLFRPSPPESTTFLERRTLTPHDRLAPIPRQQPDASAIPPVPAIDPSHWDTTTTTTITAREQGEGEGVFSCPLDISIALAPIRIRVSHRGSAVSHRSVPLCVYKCAEFIRLTAPHPPSLFSAATRRAGKVDALHNIFNAAPHYGATFDFTEGGYTPSDAAHLILLYLERLPKPVVPPSVVKGWIVLARRHARPGGTGGMEEEETLDFWAEALNRLGTMERNLAKLVLEVFAVVLGPGEEGERGLAGDVAGAVFHGDSEGGGGGGLLRKMSRGRTRKGEAVAALGFLVRRRGEYLRGLGGGGEGGFLPSVGEVMGWRGEGRK